MLFARNAIELNNLKDIAVKVSNNERFQNIVIIVLENVFGDNNYERFIEYQANATCASKHNLPDQYAAHTKSASDMIKDWMGNIRRGNFTYYIRGQQDINTTTKIASTINACVSPTIFEHGAESLEIIKTRFSKTHWKKVYANQVVDYILSYNTKDDIISRCGGQSMHVNYLLQDSVDENLKWKDDVDKNHPLYLVSEFIDKKFKHTDKNQSFNLGEKLIDLTKPPWGLYQSYAGMGMVAFAMRKYIKQIFDLNGKPREAQHLVEDIVELFKAWESKSQSNKLNFRFETKESRSLCEILIKKFKLRELKDYNHISSLTDARWAINHEFSEQKGFPLWSLKYKNKLSETVILPEGFKILIDNILKICGDIDIRNPILINETLNGIETYDFELGNLLNSKDSFKEGFNNYLKSIEFVNLQDNEIEEATDYVIKNLEKTVGLWTENEVYDKLKDWRMIKNIDKPKPIGGDNENIDDGNEIGDSNGNNIDIENTESQKEKRTIAIDKIKQISSVSQAQKLLEKICEAGNEAILDIINDYDV